MMSAELVETIKAVQYELKRRGLYLAEIDGIPGNKTWAAIHQALGAPAAGGTPAPALDDRSEKNISTLLPPVQDLARRFLTQALADNINAKITSGTRTYEEQDALYEIGRSRPDDDGSWEKVTNARAGYSNHNFGLAFDITIFHGKLPLDGSPDYAKAGAIGKALGLTWGGDWSSFTDEAHYELHPEWAADFSESAMVAELRRRHEIGESLLT